jgi:transcriptional regulator with XRE-family HTH domain
MHGGDRLAAWRKAKGLSQEQVALMVGVTQNTISDWENERKQPQISSAIRLAEASTDEDGTVHVPIDSWLKVGKRGKHEADEAPSDPEEAA